MTKLIVISSDTYVRNYLRSGAFLTIEDDATYYIASAAVTHRSELESKPRFLGYFEEDAVARRLNRLLLNILMFRHRDRSPTFGFRFRRLYVEPLWRKSTQIGVLLRGAVNPPTTTPAVAPNMLPSSAPKPGQRWNWRAAAAELGELAVEAATIWLFGRPLLAALAQRAFEAAARPNPVLEHAVATLRPDLVLFPCQAADSVGNDILRLGRRYRFRSFFLADNWDNLSSKSVFLHPPDYLGVWGEQSVEHARDIHRIDSRRVFKLGTPRFSHYDEAISRVERRCGPQSPYDFRYVLFAGCAIAFDERTSLLIMDDALDALNRALEVPLKIVYRPHPWRQPRRCDDTFRTHLYRHVVLDRQITHEDLAIGGRRFQPDLAYYPGLLANAEMVVGPLTTMLIEAALFRKTILAIAYDDGVHLTSPHNALRYYKHFQGIDRIPGLVLARDLRTFGEDFHRMVEAGPLTLDRREHAAAIEYFLHRDGRSYADRLGAAIASLPLQTA